MKDFHKRSQQAAPKSEKSSDMKKSTSSVIYILLAALAVVIALLAMPSFNPVPAGDRVNQQSSSVGVSERQKRLAGLATGNMAAFQVTQAPTPVPAFSFQDEAGKQLTLADFKGKIVLLNLWATWCAPCLHEMPTLDRLQHEMGSDTFEVLALSIDFKGMPAVKKMFKKLKITNLKLYNDQSAKAARHIGVKGMPATLLIDEKGQELGRLSGPAIWDSTEAKHLVSAVLPPKQ